MVDRSDLVDAWRIAKIASADEPESFRNAFIRAIQGNVRVPGVFAPIVLSRGWQGDLWSKHYLDLDPEGGKVLFHVGGVQSPCLCTITIDSQCPTSQRHPYAYESDRMIERVYDDAIYCDHSVMMLHGTVVAHGGATQAALYRLGIDLESMIQEMFRIASGGGYWFMEQDEDPSVEARKLWDRMRFVRWCLEQVYADQSKNSIGNRVRNALVLMAQRSVITNRSVRFGLIVAALEALLSDKRDGIGDDLSRKVAALLVEHPVDRPEAMKFVKKAYDVRSRVFHGERARYTSQDEKWMFDVVSEVLTRMHRWVEWRNRADLSGSALEFLAELRDAEMTGRTVVGVNYISGRYYFGDV